MDDPISAKSALRREMRALRKALPDQVARSDRLWQHVRALDAVQEANVVMAFRSVNGEPHTAPFIGWCLAEGKTVVVPEDDPDAASVDVVVVPGTAFTWTGERVGQGGGWYDRFLPGVRADCVTVGVCFEPQLLEYVPTEPHDTTLDLIVTDAGGPVPPQG